MLPFGVTIPATVPQGSEIPEGLTNNPVITSTSLLKLEIIKMFLKAMNKEGEGFDYVRKKNSNHKRG
jgi:hypothetical protein